MSEKQDLTTFDQYLTVVADKKYFFTSVDREFCSLSHGIKINFSDVEW
jgi:hypothetical protein